VTDVPSLHGRPVALVTGGSRGIGRGICVALSHAGYDVAVNYQRNETAARETVAALASGTGSMLCQADVSSAADRERLVSGVLGRWGRLDVLVNNAGISSLPRADLLAATEQSWDRVIDVNLKGAFFLSQSVAREMIRLAGAGIADYRPAIVNISSVSAYAASLDRGDYCISKAGMSMMTQLLALRLAEHGVRVYEVRPGIIESEMTAGAREKYTEQIAAGLTPIRRWGTPEDVGRVVVALVTGLIPYSTGEAINVDGGFHLRGFPR
jgi:NAD(P)-dependent dehydrogenase (short-subunit alcohol dehydrogenase family)